MGKFRELFHRKKQESEATSNQIPVFPDGVKTWVDSSDATLDVCFIHGLTGGRDTTWTAPGQSMPWPQMLLPDKLPKARLLTFGYDAYVMRKSVTSTNTLVDHATNLLNDLTNDRLLSKTSSRRIIFIAHSLGGLVCKEAILQSRNHPETHLRDIFQSVVGVIFMGTPHQGSWMADWANIPANTLGLFKSTNMNLLQILKTEDQLLQSIQSKFLAMVRELREGGRHFEVTCFFEELPLPVLGRVVVTKASATFVGYSLLSVHANHSKMVKFDSADDNGFKRLLGELMRWDNAIGSSSSGHQLASTTSHVEEDRYRAVLPHQRCQKSLSFPEMDNRFKDIDRATKGTCEWLFRHEMYKSWAACDRGLLWIKGKPGSGKSTLLQYALTNILNAPTNPKDKPLILSFFFHGRGVELQRTPLGFLRSLLHQLLRRAPDTLSDLVTTFHDRCKDMGDPGKNWQWHPRELQDFLKSSLLSILGTRSIYLFVDALDECGKKDAIDLAQNFKSLIQGSPPTNSQFLICFTCRHYPILNLHYGFEICLEDENKDAISIYVQDRLRACIDSTIPATIPKTITKRASGVFMWTRLVLERIIDREREGMGWGVIEDEINAVPAELDDLYKDLVTGVKEKAASLKLIRWLCLAMRPLSLGELRWAMVFDANCSYRSLQEYQNAIVDDNKMNRQIQALSCGLAEIAPSSTRSGDSSSQGIVQFIHQSVKDFFVEKGLLILDPVSETAEYAIWSAHYQLSRTCIRYLAMEEVQQLVIDDLEANWELDFPLLYYATTRWVLHEKESQKRADHQEDLLQHFDWPSEDLVTSWVSLYNEIEPGVESGVLMGTRMIHVVSHFGLPTTLRAIIQVMDRMNLDIDPQDGRGRTPLSHAAQKGHTFAVELLLGTGKVEADSKDGLGYTPLSYAAMEGHIAIVRLLLNTGKVEPDSRDNYGETPLSYAATNNHLAIVKLLLDMGAEPGAKDSYGLTPLSYAANRGHQAIVQLLLDKGVEPDPKDGYNTTPLWYAAGRGHQAIVRILLSTGKVSPDIKDKLGQTSLSYAASRGHKAVVRLLLDTGMFDPDSKDGLDRTPLSHAAARGHLAVVRLLLDTGKVDADSKNKFGKTPLSFAIDNGHQDIVQPLLDTGKVDPNSKDSFGETPLSYAARGHQTAVQLLLDTGKVEVDSKDNEGRTPLSQAAGRGHREIVRLLLDVGRAAADLRDNFGQTPLSRAVEGGHEAVVQLIQDRHNSGVLSHVGRNGHKAVL